MKHRLDDHHHEHLRNLGVKHGKKDIFIPPAEYEQHAAAWRRTLPNATEEEIHMKVIGHHASKVHALRHHQKPTRPERLAWAIITLLLILIGITLFAPKAHGQYSKINSIQFQQDGANISGAFFTFPFTINCTVNVTCSIVDGKLVMNASASGSGITTLNTLTDAVQTLSVTNDTNVTGSWTSVSPNHALVLGWTGTLAKTRQNSVTAYSDVDNAFSFHQTLTGDANNVTILKLKRFTDTSPTGSFINAVKADGSTSVFSVSAINGNTLIGTNANLTATKDNAQLRIIGTSGDASAGLMSCASNDADNTLKSCQFLVPSYVNAQSAMGVFAAFAGTATNELTIGSDSSNAQQPTSIYFNTAAAVNTNGRNRRWQITGAGHLLAVTDNAADIGASGATRPRTGYFATSLVAPTINATTGFQVGGVALAASNIGLGSVTNDAQTKASVVPNTAPTTGQILAGNAGGTAYAPVSMSQDCTITSAGVITCTKTNNVLFGTAATAVAPANTTATASNFFTAYTSATGAFTKAQPAFTDISGTASAAQLPNPTASTLGGIESLAATSHQWINTISTSGVPSSTQPAFSDISSSVAASQMPALTGECTTSAGAVSVTCGSAIAHIVVSGTSTFTTTAVASGACQTTVTTPATGAVASTDTMSWNWTTAPVAATDARLRTEVYITADNVNFMRCNPTAASVTPTALVARWKVLR